MSNLGMGIMGYVDAYPAIQQQLLQRQQAQMQMQQQRQQMQQQAAARQAYQGALGQMAQGPGQGPNGLPSLQQMAGWSGGNMDAMQGMTNMVKPYINPYASIERADIMGDYGLQRTQMQGDNALNRTEAAGENATNLQQMKGDQAQKRVDTQQAGANSRAQMVNQRIQQRQQVLKAGKDLTYDAATKVYHETEVDLRSLKEQYMRASQFDPSISPMDYVKDPQFKELATQRQQALGVMTKKEKAGDTAPAAAPAAQPGQPAQIKSDADYDALPSGAKFMAPDGSLRMKP